VCSGQAGLVSFVNIHDQDYLDLQLQTAATLASNPERFAQTAIGWAMHEQYNVSGRMCGGISATGTIKTQEEAIHMASVKLTDA
jgi:hypothetical protein